MRFGDARELLAALERYEVRYVLVGSIGMAARGVVRATQDIDLFVDPSPGNVARLRQALRSVFDDASIDEITSDDLAGEYPVVRYGPPDGAGGIDLIGRLGEAYRFDDIESDIIEVDDVRVRVATARMRNETRHRSAAGPRGRRGAPSALRSGGIRVPVSKYRSISELGPPPVGDSPTDNVRAAFALMELCYWLRPWQMHRGVRRYRSVDAPPEPSAS